MSRFICLWLYVNLHLKCLMSLQTTADAKISQHRQQLLCEPGTHPWTAWGDWPASQHWPDDCAVCYWHQHVDQHATQHVVTQHVVTQHVVTQHATQTKKFSREPKQSDVYCVSAWSGDLVTSEQFSPDPPENCHLIVKKLPKTCHYF